MQTTFFSPRSGRLGLGTWGVNVGNSSGRKSLSQKLVDVLKETLPAFTFDEGTPAHPPPLGEIVDLDAIGAAIPDLLRSHWAAQGL